MAKTSILLALFVVCLSYHYVESFRLLARFPSSSMNVHEKPSKKSAVCQYCKYDTRYFEQKVKYHNY